MLGSGLGSCKKVRAAASALELMRNNNITQLIVADNDIYLGVIHLHDLLKEGIV